MGGAGEIRLNLAHLFLKKESPGRGKFGCLLRKFIFITWMYCVNQTFPASTSPGAIFLPKKIS